jgi:hypothetical protein
MYTGGKKLMAQSQALFSLQAAADYMGNGAIIVPEFQPEITDLVRRAGVLGARIEHVPATGSISRWFDEVSISDGQYTDPRSIAPTATSPVRVEKSLVVKAITNRIDYSLFDLETVGQQAEVFAQLKGKDMKDMVNGMLRLRDKGLWSGSDTVNGAQVGAGTSQQYVGLLNQISKTMTIASGNSIVDAIRTQVAQLVADPDYVLNPTAVYLNPLALDFLEMEVKNSNTAVRFVATDLTNVKAGLSVMGIQTAAGLLPLIPEPFLAIDATIPGIAAAPSGQANYPFAILTEDLLEMHYIGSKDPRVFQLGRVSNLNESYVGIHFAAPVAKMANKAHVLGVIQR